MEGERVEVEWRWGEGEGREGGGWMGERWRAPKMDTTKRTVGEDTKVPKHTVAHHPAWVLRCVLASRAVTDILLV